ncbi:MAG: hypothetical protein ACLPY5_03755 [Candidatus Bathyarchaeia archaeon]
MPKIRAKSPVLFFAPTFLIFAPLIIGPVVFLTVVPALVIFAQEKNLTTENLGLPPKSEILSLLAGIRCGLPDFVFKQGKFNGSNFSNRSLRRIWMNWYGSHFESGS